MLVYKLIHGQMEILYKHYNNYEQTLYVWVVSKVKNSLISLSLVGPMQ